MSTINLLYKRTYKINDNISVVIPTVGEIVDDESGYYGLLYILTAMPIDMMVQLDDAGIDFTTIDEYELFLLMMPAIKTMDTHLVFGDLDLTKFEMAINEQNGMVVLVDKENDIVIDKAIHGQIADILRKIHHIEKDVRKPGNDDAKKYLIERARKKLKRSKNKKEPSQIETLIIAMVNTEQYKYDFEGTRELSIYQFNECVRQIINKIDYDNRMIGIYTGNISAKDMNQDDLNWLTHKQ